MAALGVKGSVFHLDRLFRELSVLTLGGIYSNSNVANMLVQHYAKLFKATRWRCLSISLSSLANVWRMLVHLWMCVKCRPLFYYATFKDYVLHRLSEMVRIELVKEEVIPLFHLHILICPPFTFRNRQATQPLAWLNLKPFGKPLIKQYRHTQKVEIDGYWAGQGGIKDIVDMCNRSFSHIL
mgnify:FL=1